MQNEHQHSPEKRSVPKGWIGFGLAGIALVSALAYYSESQKQTVRESQERYERMTANIKTSLGRGDCESAMQEYEEGKALRAQIVESGLYYSLHPHAVQAHAIEIAECFAARGDYNGALGIIRNERSNDADFLSRAATIEEDAKKGK